METTNEHQPQTAVDLKGALVLKGNALQVRTTEPHNPPVERKFKNGKEFKEIVMNSGKLLFGENTLLLNAEKIEIDFFPDGLLFDLKDPDNPKLYLLNLSLSKDVSYWNLFPEIIRYFVLCYEDNFSAAIFDQAKKNIGWRKKIKSAIGNRDLKEFLLKAINNKPSVLLVTDAGWDELLKMLHIYSDSCGKRVKQILIRKFQSNGDTVCVMEPGFAEIQNGKATVKKKRDDGIEYNEDFHLQKTSETIKGIYAQVRAELLKADNTLVFHAKKYYISVGKPKLFLFRFSKSKITIVVMISDKDARKQIKHHEVRTLADSVQKFWNGPSCEVVIENAEKLNEIVAMLKKLIKSQQ